MISMPYLAFALFACLDLISYTNIFYTFIYLKVLLDISNLNSQAFNKSLWDNIYFINLD